MTSSIGNNSYYNNDQSGNQMNQEIKKLSIKDNTFAKPSPPKEDFFDEIMMELENTNKEPKKNKENNLPNIYLNNKFEQNLYEFEIPKSPKNSSRKEDSQYISMKKLKEGLQIQPHFDFGIPLNENASLSIIQKYKEKKEILDVIDSNLSTKKLILTKNVKKNSKDKGKIKILYEYFVNIGDLLLFKKPQSKADIVYGEEYLELDIKDIQKIIPFDYHEN